MESDTLTMYPVEMSPPNNLRRGMVVVDKDDPARRGVVLSNPGELSGRRMGLLGSFIAPDDVAIRINFEGWHETFTSNQGRKWEVVPHDKQTVKERVFSTHLTWQPLTRRTAQAIAESGEADDDHEPWHLLYSLLPPEEAFCMTGGGDEWPDVVDLALKLAELLDSRKPRNTSEA